MENSSITGLQSGNSLTEREEVFSPLEFVQMTWRHKWLFGFVSAVFFVVGIVVILKIPAIYRATGLILIEQQEIPTQWVNTTVASHADERIQAIRQRVMNTENLVKIIEKHNLYASDRGQVAIDQLVKRARENFFIENVQARIRDRNTGRAGSATVAFKVSFDDPSAEVARDVATELVSLYLDENVKSRTKAIVDTREFLKSEADRLEQSLADIEEKISTFKEQNVGMLPEHQEINLQAFQRTEEQIADIDRTFASLNERRFILEAGIDSAQRSLASDTRASESEPTVNPLRQRLGELQTELSRLQTRYSDAHPDLIKLKREIQSVKDQIAAGGDESDGSASTVANVSSEAQDDAALIRLRTDLRAAVSEQGSLKRRREELVNKLEDLETMINQTPEVEREFKALIRDHENIQDKYNDIRAKQNSARVAESLEVEQKGEKFTLVEPPRLPLSPHSPNRKNLAVLALGVSFLGGLGSVMGIEKLQGKIRSVRAVETVARVPVLAAIGYIENRSDRTRRRRWQLLWLLLLAVIITAGFIVVDHFEITMEDLNREKVMEMLQMLKQTLIDLIQANG